MVERRHAGHVVGEDRHVRRDRSQDVHLHLVEGDDLVGRVSAEIEPVGRARFCRSQVRELDLVEVAILHRPEDVAPGGVQCVDRAVSGDEPFAKAEERSLGIRERRVMAAVFVVDLPGGESRMPLRRRGDEGGDARALGAVAFVGETIVPARAEFPRPARGVDLQHVRHLRNEPTRRRCRRRADHDLQATLVERLHRACQPLEADFAWRRLDSAPGELADPDIGDAGFRHAAGV